MATQEILKPYKIYTNQMAPHWYQAATVDPDTNTFRTWHGPTPDGAEAGLLQIISGPDPECFEWKGGRG